MHKRSFAISVRQLLLFVTFLPVAVGCIAACNALGVTTDYNLLHEPFRRLYDAVANWLSNSRGTVYNGFLLCILVILSSIFRWIISAIAISFFALIPMRISRLFALVLLISIPILEVIYLLPPPGLAISFLALICAFYCHWNCRRSYLFSLRCSWPPLAYMR